MPRSDKYPIRRSSRDDIEQYAGTLGLDLSAEEVEDYLALVNGTLDAFDEILEHGDPRFDHETHEIAARPPGRIPDADEDPLNAWIRRFRVEPERGGSLSGYTVGLKDSIALAGYPMTSGSKIFQDFVPTIDATVARRLLDAGATIVGKHNMESFAFSGSGDTSDFGPVLNPYSDEHLAGGSSSGSAAAVAREDCDIAIGTDSAGSIRIPSACCGTVGLKPTTGLVPYTGISNLGLDLDHVGPIARSVETVAATLEVLAGTEMASGVPLDPRQSVDMPTPSYTEELEHDIGNMSIGILEEGFGFEYSHDDIDATVREAVSEFEEGIANVESVSIPRHRVLSSVGAAAATMAGAQSFQDGGVSRGPDGWQWTGYARMSQSLTDARPDQLPPSLKQALLTAEHVEATDGIAPYAIGQNIALAARGDYDDRLDEVDVLAMPTVVVPPMTRDPDLDRVDATSREWTFAANTVATDLTGHPAISVPCGMVDGLPVGMMFVGPHFDEETLLQVAHRFEQQTDWASRSADRSDPEETAG